MPRVQSEYEVETIFLDRLQEMNYEYIELKDYDAVIKNFRKKLANIDFKLKDKFVGREVP